MLVSLNWIKRYLDLNNINLKKITESLNSLGLEVASAKPLCVGTNLIIGYVETKLSHPNANKLSICQVNVGTKKVQVVCGAENVKQGQHIILAKPGAILANNVHIKKTNIRGQESNGMICALNELGYPEQMILNSEINGIHVVSQMVEIGDHNPLKTLGLDDIILDISLTPNRADCLSLWQIAKELQIAFGNKLKQLPVSNVKINRTNNHIKTTGCSVFTSLKISNIKNQKTPEEIKQTLIACGVKSKNILVDIGNYVMIETGQPLHFYDASKITKLEVKSGKKAQFLALDGNDYEILPNDLVIADNGNILGLAGVIGGNKTAITKKTNEVIIESAIFDYVLISKTAKRLNIFSEAAIRYMKKRDPAQIIFALGRVVYLFQKYLPEAIINEVNIDGDIISKPKVIELNYNKVRSYLGININNNEMEEILATAGFIIHDGKVSVPSIRLDIEYDIDLIEEIARIYGYEKIPSKINFARVSQLASNLIEIIIKKTKDLLTALGGYEVISYTLEANANINFNLIKNQKYQLLKPLSEKRTTLRLSTIPALIEICKFNIDQGNKDLNIYEVSQIIGQKHEYYELGILHYGNLIKQSLFAKTTSACFFTIKGYIESLMIKYKISKSRFSIKKMAANSFYNHYAAAELFIGKELVGRFGEVNLNYLKKYKLKNVFVGQLNLDIISACKTSPLKIKSISSYPSVVQNVTFDIDCSCPVVMLITALNIGLKMYLENIEVISLYIDDKIGKDKKAVSLQLTFNGKTKTLNESDIIIINRQIQDIATKFPAEIRE